MTKRQQVMMKATDTQLDLLWTGKGQSPSFLRHKPLFCLPTLNLFTKLLSSKTKCVAFLHTYVHTEHSTQSPVPGGTNHLPSTTQIKIYLTQNIRWRTLKVNWPYQRRHAQGQNRANSTHLMHHTLGSACMLPTLSSSPLMHTLWFTQQRLQSTRKTPRRPLWPYQMEIELGSLQRVRTTSLVHPPKTTKF